MPCTATAAAASCQCQEAPQPAFVGCLHTICSAEHKVATELCWSAANADADCIRPENASAMLPGSAEGVSSSHYATVLFEMMSQF